MTRDRLMHLSARWFTLLQTFYPRDFREEMGEALVEAYTDRAREAIARRGTIALAALWMRALGDSLRNGLGERLRPAAAWRRGGNWGRDVELVSRRLWRAPAFAAVTIATLTLGLGMFAVVYTAVQTILIDPMPSATAVAAVYRYRRAAAGIHLRPQRAGRAAAARRCVHSAAIRPRATAAEPRIFGGHSRARRSESMR